MSVDFIRKVGSKVYKQAQYCVVGNVEKKASGQNSISGLHYVNNLQFLSKEMMSTSVFLQCEVRFREQHNVTLKKPLSNSRILAFQSTFNCKTNLSCVCYLMEKEHQKEIFSTYTSFSPTSCLIVFFCENWQYLTVVNRH